MTSHELAKMVVNAAIGCYLLVNIVGLGYHYAEKLIRWCESLERGEDGSQKLP